VLDINDLLRTLEQSEGNADLQLSALRDNLLRYCRTFCKSTYNAEDVVQTTLLKAIPILQGRYPHPNILALLRRIAKNTWFDHVRKQGKCQPYCFPEISTVCGFVLPKDRFEVEEALQVLMKVLTPQQRTVFLLCDVFQYTGTEAGELLGISRGAVKATRHRARVQLDSMPHRDDIQSGRDDVQEEILRAYVIAFHSANIAAIIHLCQGGGRTNGGTQMSMRAAA